MLPKPLSSGTYAYPIFLSRIIFLLLLLLRPLFLLLLLLSSSSSAFFKPMSPESSSKFAVK